MATLSHEHKFFFIHVEKTGGSSVNTVLMNSGHLNKDVDILKKTGIINFKQPQFRGTEYYGGDRGAQECIGLFGDDIWDEYFTFAFVRNPWDRMYSWYRYLINDGAMTADISLKTWLLNYNFKGRMKQTTYFLDKDGKNRMKFLGRYENLQADFDKICNTLNFPTQKLPHINKSPNKLPYYEFYNIETKSVVSKIFAEEIKLLEYEYGP